MSIGDDIPNGGERVTGYAQRRGSWEWLAAMFPEITRHRFFLPSANVEQAAEYEQSRPPTARRIDPPRRLPNPVGAER